MKFWLVQPSTRFSLVAMLRDQSDNEQCQCVIFFRRILQSLKNSIHLGKLIFTVFWFCMANSAHSQSANDRTSSTARTFWVCLLDLPGPNEPLGQLTDNWRYFISDIFADNSVYPFSESHLQTDDDAEKSPYSTAFTAYIEANDSWASPKIAELKARKPPEYWQTRCYAQKSYDEALKLRTDLIATWSKQINAGAKNELHWIAPGTKPGNSIAVDTQKDFSSPKPIACKKIESVRVTSEIRETSELGSREVHLTIVNNSDEKATCGFVAHKDGRWGVPGMQDISAGQTMEFVSDTGNVSNPVAYRCVSFIDSEENTQCFPPRWWVNVAPSSRK